MAAMRELIILAPDVTDALPLHRHADKLDAPVRLLTDGAELVPLLHQDGAAGQTEPAAGALSQVVVLGRAGLHGLPEVLERCAGRPALPLSLIFGTDLLPALPELPGLIDLGLTGWWPREVLDDLARLKAALALDAARWQREVRLLAQRNTEIEALRTRFDERKWVDRAKGVLMNARQISEDEAFRLLRGAAMHASLRVGEVSRAVIGSARQAEAVNRAGQLRMLSQRLVKLSAQRLAGVEIDGLRSAADEAGQRVRDNLAMLGALAVELGAEPGLALSSEAAPPVWAGALAAVQHAWAALEPVLDAPRLSGAVLAVQDERAEALLDAAEALTTALEADGHRRPLHLINLCGRQRMRVQRLAKEALLSVLLAQPQRRERIDGLLDEFETALLALERSPLSSADIRALLAAVRDEWLNLLRGLRGVHSPEGRTTLAHAGDALLDQLDRMTAAYEHSLQVIMA
jgi:hypothetical protein